MKMKTTLCAATSLALVAPAFSALSYSYAYDLMPSHEQGGTIYADDLHTGPANVFDATGDLNDGVVYGNGVTDDPVLDGGGVNSMVGWSSVGGGDTPATITVDLGGLFNVTDIDLTTYAFSPFNLGAPDDVTISYSADNVTYGTGTLHILTDGGNGPVAHSTGSTGSGVRYIRLAFDGDETAGDKWGLTELSIEGTAVPEPSSAALLGLGGLALILRRRK